MSAYLDNSSTTRPSNEAISKMMGFYTDKWGVLTQPHKFGAELTSPYSSALKAVYQLLGASEKDAVVMTSSGAEAINQAILSTYQDVALNEGKNHFITIAAEDAPALMSLSRLQAFGAAVTFLKPGKNGTINTKDFIEAITPRTALVCLSWANGMTGVIQPIAEIAEICSLRGIRLLVDGSNVLGKLFFSLKELKIDLFSFNGDNLHAPKGTGGLYIKNGIKMSPFITGGIEQGGLRAGALNVPAVIALGEASRQSLEARDYMCTEIARLKMELEMGIKKRFSFCRILFEEEEKVPGVMTVAFPGIFNESLLFLLNQKNVYASIGGGSHQLLSYYLKICGFPAEIADSAISFSLSRETKEEEIEWALDALTSCIGKLKP